MRAAAASRNAAVELLLIQDLAALNRQSCVAISCHAATSYDAEVLGLAVVATGIRVGAMFGFADDEPMSLVFSSLPMLNPLYKRVGNALQKHAQFCESHGVFWINN